MNNGQKEPKTTDTPAGTLLIWLLLIVLAVVGFNVATTFFKALFKL